jgi:hypothetical protein
LIHFGFLISFSSIFDPIPDFESDFRLDFGCSLDL